MADDGWRMMDRRSWATLEPTTMYYPPSTILLTFSLLMPELRRAGSPATAHDIVHS